MKSCVYAWIRRVVDDKIIPIGILSDVLTFMQAEIQSLSSSKNHARLEKLTECFHFLRALACQNAVVQKR
jgi:hypothetical protein